MWASRSLHPIHVLLDRHHHVGQHRGAAGPGEDEQVGEPGAATPEERPRAGRPVLPEGSSRPDRRSRASVARRSSRRTRWRRRSRRARWSPAVVWMPLGDGLDRVGSRTSTNSTLSRLNVSKYPAVDARPLGPERVAPRGVRISALSARRGRPRGSSPRMKSAAVSLDSLVEQAGRRTTARTRTRAVFHCSSYRARRSSSDDLHRGLLVGLEAQAARGPARPLAALGVGRP